MKKLFYLMQIPFTRVDHLKGAMFWVFVPVRDSFPLITSYIKLSI